MQVGYVLHYLLVKVQGRETLLGKIVYFDTQRPLQETLLRNETQRNAPEEQPICSITASHCLFAPAEQPHLNATSLAGDVAGK